MKMKTGIRILTVLTLVFLLAFAASAAGETVISDAASLSAQMGNSAAWGGSSKLGADIDLTGTAQDPIGTYETPFTGSFDGAGHTVKVNITADGPTGLFGVTQDATIRNLTVTGSVENTFAATDAETKIDGKYPGTGALCGVALSGTTIEKCTTRATVKGPGNVGGLVGVIYNYDAHTVTVKNCTGEAKIDSSLGNAGGFFGRIQISSSASPAVLVNGCSNHADVQSVSEDRNRLAGIAGYVRAEAGEVVIENCENTGKITATNSGAKASNCPFAGGITGRIEAVTDATSAVRLLNCKNTGAIESSHHAGGITAYINRSDRATKTASEIVGCLNTATVNGPSHAGGIAGYTENRCGADVRSAVKNCENRGAVSSSACAGGLVGRWYGFDILTSYNSGKVTADSLVGGIAGKAEGAIFCETNSVYLVGTADTAVGESNPICAEMGASSVTADNAGKTDSFAGFDFASTWKSSKDGPTLAAFAGGKVPETTTATTATTKATEPVATTASSSATEKTTEATTKPATTEGTAKTTERATTSAASSASSAEPGASTDAAVTTETTVTTKQTEPAGTTASTEKTVKTDGTTAPAATSATTAAPAGESSGAPIGLIIGIVIAVLAAAVLCIVLVKKKKQ